MKSISEYTRDHLANERTYLAWMRTAISLTAFGILIAKLRYLLAPNVQGTGYSWLLGITFSFIGLITVLIATLHYFSVMEAIEANIYSPSRRWALLFSLTVLLLGAGVIYILLSIPEALKLTSLTSL
jgi:putative membrane protein